MCSSLGSHRHRRRRRRNYVFIFRLRMLFLASFPRISLSLSLLFLSPVLLISSEVPNQPNSVLQSVIAPSIEKRKPVLNWRTCRSKRLDPFSHCNLPPKERIKARAMQKKKTRNSILLQRFFIFHRWKGWKDLSGYYKARDMTGVELSWFSRSGL